MTALLSRLPEAPRRQSVSCRAPVAVVPLRELLRPFAIIGLPMAVLQAGRPICLLAQRFPPAVWFVRAVFRWKAARRVAVADHERRARP